MVKVGAVPRWLRLLPLALVAIAILILVPNASAHDPDVAPAEAVGNPAGLAGIAFRGPVGTPIETSVCPPIPDSLAWQYDDDATNDETGHGHIGHINGITDPAGTLDNYIDVGSVDTWHFYTTEYNNPSGIEGPHDVTNTALSVMMGTDGFFRGRLHLPIANGPSIDFVVYDVHTMRTYCIYGSQGHDGPYFFIDSTLNDPTVSSKTNVDMTPYYEPLFSAYYPGEPVVMDHIFFVTSAYEDVEPTIPQPPKAFITLLSMGVTCDDSSVTLTAAGSYDPDGTIVSYEWDLSDGNTPTTIEVTHTFETPGPHTVTLTVTDNSAMTHTSTLQVWDKGDPSCCPAMMPMYDIWMDEGQTLALTAKATDPEGDLLTFFARRLPVGATLSSAGVFEWQTSIGHAGNYRLEIAVTDGECEDAREITIHVRRPGPTGPAPDVDLDGIPDTADNCPTTPNHEQEDATRDGRGDACDGNGETAETAQGQAGAAVRARDTDLDGVPDVTDNCPTFSNPVQENLDRDAAGDPCDVDADGDGIANQHELGAFLDNCPMLPNTDQLDGDANGIGNACQGTQIVEAGARSRDPTGASALQGLAAFSGDWLIGSILLAGIGSALLVLFVLRRRDS